MLSRPIKDADDIKACLKEGFDKGKYIASVGASVRFFHAAMTEPKGDMTLLESSLEGLNKPGKDGCRDIGKMIFSNNDEKLVFICNVPPAQAQDMNINEWFGVIMAEVGGKEIFSSSTVMKGEALKGSRTPGEMKAAAIAKGYEFLKSRSLTADVKAAATAAAPGAEGEDIEDDDDEDFPEFFDGEKIAACIKEGKLKGTEISRLAKETSVNFFHIILNEPSGDVTLLESALEGFNRETDAGKLGKMLFTHDKDKLLFLCHVPEQHKDTVNIKEWFAVIMKECGGKKLPSGNRFMLKGEAKAGGRDTVKLRGACIARGYSWLKEKSLTLKKDEDDDDDDDEDFPEYFEEDGSDPAVKATHAATVEELMETFDDEELLKEEMMAFKAPPKAAEARGSQDQAGEHLWALAWYEDLAVGGDATAQYALAECYMEGDGVAQDMIKGIDWMYKSAFQGYVPAQFRLGEIYRDGIGTRPDGQQALGWFLRAALMGSVGAEFEVGCCFEEGIGVPEDLQEALYWYEKAAESDYPPAQIRLGSHYEYESCFVMYEQETNPDKTEEEAIAQSLSFEMEAAEWYQRAADLGDAVGQYRLGVYYHHGCGVPQDLRKAVDLFILAANQDYFPAHTNLGYCYQHGLGVDRNEALAADWYHMAAQSGMAEAQTNLAICYKNGSGVERNMDKAVYWFREAADQWDMAGMYGLAKCYDEGEGVEQDEFVAAYWYLRVAEMGDPYAQFVVGTLFEEGRGVVRSPEAAAEWFRYSAEQGLPEAQFSLALCYHQGFGVPADPNMALRWYRRATNQGFGEQQIGNFADEEEQALASQMQSLGVDDQEQDEPPQQSGFDSVAATDTPTTAYDADGEGEQKKRRKRAKSPKARRADGKAKKDRKSRPKKEKVKDSEATESRSRVSRQKQVGWNAEGGEGGGGEGGAEGQ